MTPLATLDVRWLTVQFYRIAFKGIAETILINIKCTNDTSGMFIYPVHIYLYI